MAATTPTTSEPVDECEACNGHNIKIDGLCLLHYVARKYSVDEFEEAKREVERAEAKKDEFREARRQFKQRAQAVFPERHISLRVRNYGVTDSFTGENIAWANNPRTGHADIYHADKDCPHLPDGSLRAYPMSHARQRKQMMQPCSYCTVPEE